MIIFQRRVMVRDDLTGYTDLDELTRCHIESCIWTRAGKGAHERDDLQSSRGMQGFFRCSLLVYIRAI